MHTYKILDTSEVISLNQKTPTARNRRLAPDFVDRLDPQGIHVVERSLLHQDAEARCEILFKISGQDDPVTGWLDIDLDDFNKLRKVAG